MKERIKDGSSIVNKEYCTSWERYLAKLNSRYYDKLRNKNTIKGSILYSISPSILRNEQVCCDKTNTNNLCHMTKDWKYGEEPLNVIYYPPCHLILPLLFPHMDIKRNKPSQISNILYQRRCQDKLSEVPVLSLAK